MKSVVDIIREQLEEDTYIRTHEAEIIGYYAHQAALPTKKKSLSVKRSVEAEHKEEKRRKG